MAADMEESYAAVTTPSRILLGPACVPSSETDTNADAADSHDVEIGYPLVLRIIDFCTDHKVLTWKEREVAIQCLQCPARDVLGVVVRARFVLKRFLIGQVAFVKVVEAIKDLAEGAALERFDDLYKEAKCSFDVAKTLANIEKKEQQHDHNLTYGEIEFKSFVRILHAARGLCSTFSTAPSTPTSFFDLGSGTGKAVIACAMLFDFHKIGGVEIIKSLHEKAVEALGLYEQSEINAASATAVTAATIAVGSTTAILSSVNPNPNPNPIPRPVISLSCGSFLPSEDNPSPDWLSGDIVFANSTCFNQQLMTSLSIAARRMKPNAVIITFTKHLILEDCDDNSGSSSGGDGGGATAYFKIVDKTIYRMSWGPATVYTHVRLSHSSLSSSCSSSPFSSSSSPSSYNEVEGARPHEWLLKATALSADPLLFSHLGISPLPPTSISSYCQEKVGTTAAAHHDGPDLISDLLPSILVAGRQNKCIFELPTAQSTVFSSRTSTGSKSNSSSSSSSGGSNSSNSSGGSIKYLLSVPKDWSSSSFSNRPLLLFLHGASSRGDNFSEMRKYAIPLYIDQYFARGSSSSLTSSSSKSADESVFRSDVGLDMDVSSFGHLIDSFVICCPLCPRGTEWKAPQWCTLLRELVLMLIERLSIDKRRICVSGISMGGLGSFMLAARNPSLFSCAIPICGGGSKVFAKLLKDLPMWFVHSEDDNVVAVQETDALVEELRRLCGVNGNANATGTGTGAVVKYCRYAKSDERPSAQAWMEGHNCWDKFYLGHASEIEDWILQSRRDKEDS